MRRRRGELRTLSRQPFRLPHQSHHAHARQHRRRRTGTELPHKRRPQRPMPHRQLRERGLRVHDHRPASVADPAADLIGGRTGHEPRGKRRAPQRFGHRVGRDDESLGQFAVGCRHQPQRGQRHPARQR
jgi:hypothetical protein